MHQRTGVCLLSITISLLLGACAPKENTREKVVVVEGPGKNPQYFELKHIRVAPQLVQGAAKGIVKVMLPDNNCGTGFFVSEDGVFVTNNHVVGNFKKGCAREGCHIQLRFDFEAGRKSQSYDVFAEPISASVEGDISIFQVWWDSSKKVKFLTPNFLKLKELSDSQLVGKSFNLVGHPKGGLKKWSSLAVVAVESHQIDLEGVAVGGHSGSPFLDEYGDVIGILHSGNSDENAYTATGSLATTSATKAAEIIRLLKSESNPKAFASIDDPDSEDEVVEREHSYFMARRHFALIKGGRAASIFDILTRKCEDRFQNGIFATSSDEFKKRFSPCVNAMRWLNCSSKDKNETSGICPSLAVRDKWRGLLDKILARTRRAGRPFLAWAARSRHFSDDSKAGKEELVKAIMRSHALQPISMDFNLAY